MLVQKLGMAASESCVEARVVRGGGSVDVDGDGDDVSNGYSEELEGVVDRFGNGVENGGS